MPKSRDRGSLTVIGNILYLLTLAGIVYGQTALDISLDSLLNTRISTAAKYAQKISQAPASITIITYEDIEHYGFQTLEDVFNSVRGFYTTNDRNYTYLGVRGFSRPTDYNDRILLLVNGHTVNENVYGSAMLGTDFGLSLDGIERIEIVRGPSSALYGTGAMFAVVNVVTKKGRMVDGIRLMPATGSYGKLATAGSLGKEFENGLDVFIAGQITDINGQDLYFPEYDSVNNGIAQGLDWDKSYGAIATLSYKDFNWQGIFTSRKKGIPTGAFGVVFNNQNTWSLDERSFVELKYDKKIKADKNLIVRTYFDWYHYKGAYPYEVQSFDESYGNWLGIEAQYLWDLTINNRLTLGLEYQKHWRADYRLWDTDTVYFDANFPYQVISGYLQDEYQILANLAVNLGMRWDNYTTIGNAFVPRGAVIYNPFQATAIKLLYGQAFRAPNVYEINYQDPLYGHKPNPFLNPEKIRTFEVVWEQRLAQNVYGIVSVYHYGMRGLIDLTSDETDSLLQFQNIGRVKALGSEFELQTKFRYGIQGYINYAFQIASDEIQNTKLTNSPSHIAKLGLVFPISDFRVAPEVRYETERITVYNTKTKPYLLTNLNLSSPELFNHLKISLVIKNLLATEYKLPGGFEHKQDAIKQNGRNWELRLRARF